MKFEYIISQIKEFFNLGKFKDLISDLSSNNTGNAPTDIIIETGSPVPEEPVVLVITLPNGISGGYYINGEQKPVITFVKGGTYIFDQSDTSNSNHPIDLSSVFESGTIEGLKYYIDGSEYAASTYHYYLSNFAYYFDSFEIHYTVPEDAPDTLYYYCVNHSGLGSSIDVQSPGSGEGPTITENTSGFALGNLITVDEDTGDVFSYSLSGKDADKFEIVDGQLKLKNSVSLNYEEITSVEITITTTDSTGNSFAKDFIFAVANVNESPTALTLSSLRIEDQTAGYIVGQLTVTDEDVGDSFTYTLSGDDAENFEIVNGQLKLKDEVSANFEVKDIFLSDK